MAKYTLAVKIDPKVAERVRRYCAERGLKQGFFVEKALSEELDRAELAEDLLDLRRNRKDEALAVSLEEYERLRRG